MSVGSGLGGQFGIAPESVFGTFQAPTKFYEVDSASVKLDPIRVEASGIAAGRLGTLASQVIEVGRSGVANVELTKVPLTGFGLVLQHLLGTTVVPVQQGATAAYLQTRPIADHIGKFLTAQTGIPDTAGVSNPYSGVGGKITKAAFSCQADDILKASLELDLRDVSEAQTLAVASYPLQMSAFSFKDMAVLIGANVAGLAAANGVTGFSLDIERPVKTDRRYANAAGLKAEQITNALPNVSGTLTADLLSKTQFADRFAANDTFALRWEFVGPVIAAPYNYRLTFTLPACKFTGETPGIAGVDVTNNGFPFKAYLNGTDPLVTAEYVSTDVTV